MSRSGAAITLDLRDAFSKLLRFHWTDFLSHKHADLKKKEIVVRTRTKASTWGIRRRVPSSVDEATFLLAHSSSRGRGPIRAML